MILPSNPEGELMDEAAITRYITDTFKGVEIVTKDGDSYFFTGSDHRFPFVTLVTGDRHDQVSKLDRPGVFRLNVGVSKQTFQGLFSEEGDHDFAALDRIMPHPVYGKMYWVCVLNPGEATFRAVRVLLAEAYEMSDRRAGAGH
jgi:hypothetical protein